MPKWISNDTIIIGGLLVLTGIALLTGQKDAALAFGGAVGGALGTKAAIASGSDSK